MPWDACDDCLRRSWLIARLAGHLELRRADRSAIREVLALTDLQLIDALAGRRRADLLRAWRDFDAAASRRSWRSTGAGALCRHARRYPRALLDLSDPPSVLYIQGAEDRLDELLGPDGARGDVVAIVGARKASPDGCDIARALARGLSAVGVPVVSGMALGIDGAAHEGALAGGGRTVAVLACGPERAYPPSRTRLHAQLVERALVVAELPPGTAPHRWAFPARNRIIAALARMAVIVEAAERSGSLITAEIAMDLGREVGAVPGSPLAWRSTGANALLRDGAHPVRDVADVLDDLFGIGHNRTESESGTAFAVDLEPELGALLASIDGGRDTVDANAATPEEVRQVLARLTRLELLGLVERRSGGHYARATR